ncbi:probable G-protein coupled receptor frpr-1 [Eurytemora carolleeae]|uniref:probable G-protein coupled receptor frpr-1 n=1 Tax=Eurytemora carolleeae TaxID=1294199 RepID=UPI000C768358|nr:probable G-protein coupled receptor frpr-1 [Eurytemora carolleeae]|eukprot:XP_023321774.1 probable G-protein coupled receptor frpr-1 [Eurytemora affinis]
MLKFVVEGILVPVITGFGLAGNIASMLVLRSPKLDMKVSIRHILMMLALFDSLFIMFTTLSFSLLQLYPGWKTYYHGIVFPWIFPFIQISLTGSIWSTVSVAVERFLSVVYSRTWISTLSSRVYLIPVLLISILWNIPRFLELQTCYHVKPSVASLQILQGSAPGPGSSFQTSHRQNTKKNYVEKRFVRGPGNTSSTLLRVPVTSMDCKPKTWIL